MSSCDDSIDKCKCEEGNAERCPQINEIPLPDCQLLAPQGFCDLDQGVFEEKQDDIYEAYAFLAEDSSLMGDEDFDDMSLDDEVAYFFSESHRFFEPNNLLGFTHTDIHHREEECDENSEYEPRQASIEEAGMESHLVSENSPTASVYKPRVRHQNKICGIVYKEVPENSTAVEKPKPWAYYVTDSDIINFIKEGNVRHKWNIDTFVLRDLHKEFKVAKKVLYHKTEEDAIRTNEKFISYLISLLEKNSTLEQRAFLLSNSKTTYREDIADSKLSHFDYRLKVFMEVLRDPQHQETMLLKAKEFINKAKKNRKSPRAKMETEASPTNDVTPPQSKKIRHSINYVRISRSSSSSCEEDVSDLLWSTRSITSVLFNLTLLCAVWGSFVMYVSA